MNTIVCFFIHDSPSIYKRLANTHKIIAAKWWRRFQQQLLPPCSAQKQQHNHCAAPDFPQFCANYVFGSKRVLFILPLSRCPRLAKRRNQSAGQSPFSWHDLHRLYYSRKSPFTRLYCHSKNVTILSNKGSA